MRDFSLPGRSPVIAENGMAATSHPLGTMSAIQVLREAGSIRKAAKLLGVPRSTLGAWLRRGE